MPWLAVFSLCALAFDATRAPDHQVSVRLHGAGIHFYRAQLKPLLGGRVRCRYMPSCSEYSEQAVQRFGILRGLWLTGLRLSRCRTSVPMGTPDPVPEKP